MIKQIPPITIQIGCGTEWHAFEAAFASTGGFKPLKLGPFSQYHTFELEGVRFITFQGGPSKTVAAASAQHAMVSFSTGLHIMMGTCGGVSRTPDVGALMFASRAAQYDCIDRLGEPNRFFYKPFDVTVDNAWIKEDLTQLGCVEGMVATADQDIDYKVRSILSENGADVADWESAAVALVAHRNHVPVLILRGVSDIPEAKMSREAQATSFFDRTPEIMRSLCDCLPAIARRYKSNPPHLNTQLPD